MELVVLLRGRVAGVLQRGGASGSYVFTYDEEWRNDPSAFPLSLSLPLASRVHDSPRLAYYLRGLLPDSEARLNAFAHEFGVAADDPFGLLAFIGEDCTGAVQFARAERVADVRGEGAGTIDWLTDAQVADLLRELEAENQGRAAVVTGQFSLPGALAKVALTWNPKTQRWGRPSGRAATTHIIKPPLRGVKFHNENEHLCLELARATGSQAAESAILRIEDRQAIAVKRYDRERHGRVVHRLHQEDVSQALGVNTRLKYPTEGAPGIADIVTLLRDQASTGIDDVYRFLRAVAFNWVIGGTDAHPRNYSVLIGPRGAVTLAPLYDLASALRLKTRVEADDLPFAMTVARRRTIGSITRSVWEEQAREVRLNPGRAIEEIDDLLQQIVEHAAPVAAAAVAAGIDEKFANRFASRLSRRARDCGTRL